MALDPRTEASERLGGREVRVLEPSPPAVQEGPWFADDPVAPEGADELRAPLTTLRAAAQLAGVPGEDDETPLAVDAAASAALGRWYGFCCSVLEELRVGAADPSRVQLWPEHFDLALEAGSEEAGARAACGGSPGDEEHPEPYLYVAPWSARPEGARWNATAFLGAELSYAELLVADDQRELALDFFRTRLDDLAA